MLQVTGHILTRPPGCRCHSSCEFPCWQRVGWATPCEACGCQPAPTVRGHVAAGDDLERCPACAMLKASGVPCPDCGWRRNDD